jgi:hypothetical protein
MIEFYHAADTTPPMRRMRDQGTLLVQISPGEQAFDIPKTFATRPVAVSIDGKTRGPEAFHVRSLIKLFRDKFSNEKFRLIVYFEPHKDDDALIIEAAAEAIGAGMNCLIVETREDENAAWVAFLAKHLSVIVSEARHGR